MELHKIIIAILVVGFVAGSMVTFIGDTSRNYGKGTDFSSMNATQNSVNETRADVLHLQELIDDFELELNPIDLFTVPYKMIQVGWTILNIMFGSAETVGNMITDSSSGLQDSGVPLPEGFDGIVYAIFITTLVAVIVYGWYKWKFSD